MQIAEDTDKDSKDSISIDIEDDPEKDSKSIYFANDTDKNSKDSTSIDFVLWNMEDFTSILNQGSNDSGFKTLWYFITNSWSIGLKSFDN